MNGDDKSQTPKRLNTPQGGGIGQLLTPKQASEILNVPQGTLRSWRSRGRGPAYIKIEGQAVKLDIPSLICKTIFASTDTLLQPSVWAHERGICMSVYKRDDSKYHRYDFTVAGIRYRGSTKQTSEPKARTLEAKLIAEAEANGPQAIRVKAPTLSGYVP